MSISELDQAWKFADRMQRHRMDRWIMEQAAKIDREFMGRPFTQRPTHKLSHSQAREWVMAELIGEHVLAPVPYETWRVVLTQWQTIRLKAGYLDAAVLIGDLLAAGAWCRDVRTRESIDQVAALWVRCHDEAGVACEEC